MLRAFPYLWSTPNEVHLASVPPFPASPCVLPGACHKPVVPLQGCSRALQWGDPVPPPTTPRRVLTQNTATRPVWGVPSVTQSQGQERSGRKGTYRRSRLEGGNVQGWSPRRGQAPGSLRRVETLQLICWQQLNLDVLVLEGAGGEGASQPSAVWGDTVTKPRAPSPCCGQRDTEKDEDMGRTSAAELGCAAAPFWCFKHHQPQPFLAAQLRTGATNQTSPFATCGFVIFQPGV